MKIPSVILSLLVLSCLIPVKSLAWAQSPPTSTASITPAVAAVEKNTRAGITKVIEGDVRLMDAQGIRPLKSGDPVFSGDRLLSGKSGLASVVLRDGTTLMLSNNSQLQIQQFDYNSTTTEGKILVDLVQGSIRVVTGLISKLNPNAVQVKTNTLLVGVRGTDFIVESEKPFSF